MRLNKAHISVSIRAESNYRRGTFSVANLLLGVDSSFAAQSSLFSGYINYDDVFALTFFSSFKFVIQRICDILEYRKHTF